MTASEGYGQRLAERLRAEQAHAIVTRVLRTADIAVTETRCDDPAVGLSHSIQREDAYLVALTLRDFPNRQYWEDGRQMPVCDLRIGQVDFHDLKRDPVAVLAIPQPVFLSAAVRTGRDRRRRRRAANWRAEP